VRIPSVPGTNKEGQQRVDLARSPSQQYMTAICAFETSGDVSCRRIADVADRRRVGRLNWAGTGLTGTASGRTGVGAKAAIPS